MAWYTIDTINTCIMSKIVEYKRPMLFKGAGFLDEKLWAKKKQERINRFEVPIRHASDAKPQGLTPFKDIEGSHNEIIIKGWDDMVMGGDLAVISYEEGATPNGIGIMGGGNRVIDLIKERTWGKMEGQKNAQRASMWRRAASTPGSTTQNLQSEGMYDVYDITKDIHNLDYEVYSIWQSIIIDATALEGYSVGRAAITQDPTVEYYIENLMDRIVSNFHARGVSPDDGFGCMGSGLYSAYRSILRAQDQLRPGPRMAKLGYDSVVYRGYEFGEDDRMSVNQTGDDDGWLCGVCLRDLDLFCADKNGITVGPWKDGMKQTYLGSQLRFYRQFVCRARYTQIFITGVWNKKSFIADPIES